MLQRYNAKIAGRINMKIKPINKMQNILDKTIKVAKFSWRHFFVISLLVLLVIAFIDAPAINWKVFANYLSAAIALDWIKTKIRFSKSDNSHYHQAVTDSFRKHSEWATNPAKIGSPANHLYNLGYNPGKYH